MSAEGFCHYAGEECPKRHDRQKCNDENPVVCRTKRQKNEVKTGRWGYAETGEQEKIEVDLQ